MDPIPSPIAPLDPIPPQSVGAPRQKNSWTLIWIIVVLLAGIAIGLLLGNKSLLLGMKLPGISPTPTPISIPTPSPTPDPTADWKIYTKDNYQVKYPSDWSIENSPYGFSVKQGNYKISFTTSSLAYGPSICIFSDSPNFTNPYPDNPIFALSKCPGEFITINGSGFIFRRKSLQNSTPEGIQNGHWTIYVKDSNGEFVTVPPIEYATPISNVSNTTLLLMDQILSTFRFTENNQTTETLNATPTPNYLTTRYTDKTYGYTIMYNNNWTLRQTYGPDIPKSAPTDILSGIDLHKGGLSNQQAVIVVNLLEAHGLTNVDEWINQYDLNYPKTASREYKQFGNKTAALYRYRTEPNSEGETWYFIVNNHVYRINLHEPVEISLETRTILESLVAK